MSYLDNTSLGKLRREFCAGTGYSSPDELIRAGIKTMQDWLDALDQHRLVNPSHAKPTTTEPLKAELTIRKKILDYLFSFDQSKRYGFGAKEIADGIGKTNNTVRDILNDLVEEGLLSSVQVIRAKHSKETRFYRLAVDEVNA
jgi:DNA-binding MarR family transcriptional regulator